MDKNIKMDIIFQGILIDYSAQVDQSFRLC